MRPKYVLLSLIMVFMVMSLISKPCYSAFPKLINYQGNLSATSGTNINSTVTMTFSLYTQQSGGSSIWAEAQTVSVTNGYYSVVLGNLSPINLLFDTQYYLGVKVNTDSEMIPRHQLVAMPYAMRASTTDKLGLVCKEGEVLGYKEATATWDCAAPYAGTQGPKGDIGPQGPQGPKGDTGATGQVTLTTLCTAISTGGAQLPSFCPGYSVTYSLADLKGTWKSHRLQSNNGNDGTLSNISWNRGTAVINDNGFATVTSTANSNNQIDPPSTFTLNISSDGTVTIQSAPPLLNFSGNMSLDKNLIVITSNHCSTYLCRGITILVKVAP